MANKLEQIKKLQIARGVVANPKIECFGYIRVSTEEQRDEGHSLDAQRSVISTYADKNNYTLVKIYSDEGLSGSKRDRPGLLELIENLKKGMIVLVTETDRLSRDNCYLLNVKEEIHGKGCHIIFINRNLDTSKPEGNLILSILGAIDEEERNRIRRRISQTMRDMSQKGTLRKKPTFGFRYDENKELVENEEEQLIIAHIRDLANDPTMTLAKICRNLEENNIKIGKCKKIYRTSVENIMKRHNIVLQRKQV